MNFPLRCELISPVAWQGQTVTAITIERLSLAQIERLGQRRGMLRERQIKIRASAIAAHVPEALIKKLHPRDLDRLSDMVLEAIALKTEELERIARW